MADAELGLGHFDAVIDEKQQGDRCRLSRRLLLSEFGRRPRAQRRHRPGEDRLCQARRLNPKLSVKWLSEHKPIPQPAFEALHKAGLPEE
jgi:hypothetical protein